ARGQIDGSPDDQALYERLSEVTALRDPFEQLQEEVQTDPNNTFYAHLNASRNDITSTQVIAVGVVTVAASLLPVITLTITRSIVRPLDYAVTVADSIAEGDWDMDIQVRSRDETGRLLSAIRQMRDTLKTRREEDRREELKKQHIAELNNRMRGDLSMQQLGT